MFRIGDDHYHTQSTISFKSLHPTSADCVILLALSVSVMKTSHDLTQFEDKHLEADCTLSVLPKEIWTEPAIVFLQHIPQQSFWVLDGSQFRHIRGKGYSCNNTEKKEMAFMLIPFVSNFSAMKKAFPYSFMTEFLWSWSSRVVWRGKRSCNKFMSVKVYCSMYGPLLESYSNKMIIQQMSSMHYYSTPHCKK